MGQRIERFEFLARFKGDNLVWTTIAGHGGNVGAGSLHTSRPVETAYALLLRVRAELQREGRLFVNQGTPGFSEIEPVEIINCRPVYAN